MNTNTNQQTLLADARVCLVSAHSEVRRAYEKSLKKIDKEAKRGNEHYRSFAQKKADERAALLKRIEELTALITSNIATN